MRYLPMNLRAPAPGAIIVVSVIYHTHGSFETTSDPVEGKGKES